MSAEDYIHIGIAAADPFNHMLLLHHASADRYDHLLFLFLIGFAYAKPPVEPLVRILPYSAGIIYKNISLLLGGSLFISHFL